MRVRRRFPVLLALVCCCAAGEAQSPQQPPTLSTGTQLVVVDVTVQDRSGHPVHGLKPTDFMLSEGKSSQVIKSFDEHTSAQMTAAHGTDMPKLPPGVFTDYSPVPDTPALNILLLDSLNTPMKDQSYVRYQLQQYVKHLQPGARIAIFGLTRRLIILQGFTSDPESLKAAVEHKLIPRASSLLDDPVGSNTDTTKLSDVMNDLGNAQVAANMAQFEAETASFQTQMRLHYTLDAFNALARYLVQFPGRKNLIWFSGSFPINILPDGDLQNPFGVVSDAEDEFRDTTNLLNRSRVAVYPVDARGLQTLPMFEASQSGSQYARNPGAMGRDAAKFSSNNAQEHMTMDQLAEDTGGRAFYNTNGLADAVAKSIDAGSNFYTITYSPTDRNWNGSYRAIHVALQGAPAGNGYRLSFRHGYYAEDPNGRHTAATSSVMTAKTAEGPPTGSANYAHAVMMRAAPTPSELLFKVRVLPDSTATTTTLVPGNSPDPAGHLKLPYRTFDIDFAALANGIQLKSEQDGRRHGALEFLTFVYDADGALLNIADATVNMSLQPGTYAAMAKTGIHFRQQVSVPARGETYLRIAIHDPASGRFGVVEIPAASVRNLPPPPPEDGPPASAPATHPGTSQPAGPAAQPGTPPAAAPAPAAAQPAPHPSPPRARPTNHRQ